MNTFKRKRLVIMGILLVLALAVAYLIRTPFLQHDFKGTYLAGSGPYQLIFSVLPEDQEVYYADQDKGIYLWGRFVPEGDKAYRIIFEDTSIIPEQILVCQDTTLLLQIGDAMVPFQKDSNIPVLVSPRDPGDASS